MDTSEQRQRKEQGVRLGFYDWSGISHLVSCPRPTWALFVILFLFQRFASPFSSPPPIYI